MRTHYTALITLVAIALSAACGYQSPTSPQGYTPALSAVRLSVGTNTLQVGQSTSANATALDQYGASFTAGTPVFASSAPDIARVDPATGAILAVTPGTTITATINGTSARLTVTVIAPAAGDGEIMRQRP